MFRSVFAATLLAYAEAAFKFGSCPDITTVENFDRERYLGTWYEHARDEYTWYQYRSRCVVSDISLREDNSIKVMGYAFYKGWWGGWIDMEATLTEMDPVETNRGELFFSEVSQEGPGPDSQPNYHILATDYDSFAIIYNCMEGTFWSYENLWIKTRVPVADESLQQAAFDIIQDQLPHYEIDEWLHLTKQGDKCDYDARFD